MSSHIHLLLAAERKAIELQNEAKMAKMERLKQAREEAQDDIDQFNQKLEEDFKDKLKLNEGKEVFEQKTMEQSKVDIATMLEHCSSVQQSVVDHVLEMVLDVNPEIHMNYLLLNNPDKN